MKIKMKMKKICSAALAPLLALTLAIPAFASEAPPLPAPEVEGQTPAENDVQPPEDESQTLPEDNVQPPEDEDRTPAEDDIQPSEDEGQTSPEDNVQPAEGESQTSPEDNVQPPEDESQTSPEDDVQPPEDENRTPSENDIPPPEEPVNETIAVSVPRSGELIVNPYRMKVDTDGGETTEQIIHQPQTLVSHSGVSVAVTARAVGGAAAGSGARFVAEPPGGDAWDKEIFLYAEFQSSPDMWIEGYIGASNQLLVTEDGTESEVMVLEPYGEGYFRLFGAMSPSPDDMWSSADGFSVTLAYTFRSLEDVDAVYDGARPEGPEDWMFGFGPEGTGNADNADGVGDVWDDTGDIDGTGDIWDGTGAADGTGDVWDSTGDDDNTGDVWNDAWDEGNVGDSEYSPEDENTGDDTWAEGTAVPPAFPRV